MSDQIEAIYKPHDAFSVPVIWLAVVLSLLIHLAALWKWHEPLDIKAAGPAQPTRLTAQLLPPSPSRPPSRRAPASAAAAAATPVAPSAPKREPAKPVPATPPVLALNRPAAETPSRPAPVATPAPPTPPAPSPPVGDMSAMIEARRRARGESPAPMAQSAPSDPSAGEDDTARRDRIRAANMGINKQQAFGYDPNRGGGVFQIAHVNYDTADFVFFGWNKDIKRKIMQTIEVQRGNNPDIRIAVVRKMISIIRDYERADFVWESQRLGRNLTLSARPADNAGLEEFMMREFFDVPGRP
jgi:hypothetical protein